MEKITFDVNSKTQIHLRSQICMTGVWSSSEAKQSWGATSGCQATTLIFLIKGTVDVISSGH